MKTHETWSLRPNVAFVPEKCHKSTFHIMERDTPVTDIRSRECECYLPGYGTVVG